MSTPSLLVSHWELQPSTELLAAGAGSMYLLAAARLRGRWPARRTLSFLAGIGVVAVALESGIGTYDDRLLSAHMVQHVLLLLVAPVLLLCGQPALLALRALPVRGRRRLARALARSRALTHPLSALACFYAVVLVTHLPAVYDATLADPLLHDAEHGLYLIAGSMMWLPLLGADPVPKHQLSGVGRTLYLLATMPPMAVVGAVLNRDPGLAYAPYAAPAHALGVSAVGDQQQAGAIMWVLGSSLMVVCGLWQAMAALIDEERRVQVRERLADSALADGARER
jgi:putative membrane protein